MPHVRPGTSIVVALLVVAGASGCSGAAGSAAVRCAPLGADPSCPPWRVVPGPATRHTPDVGDTTVRFERAGGSGFLVVATPCNTLSGNYEVDGSVLTIDRLASTLAICRGSAGTEEVAARSFFEHRLRVTASDGDLVLSTGDVSVELTQ